MPTVAEVQALKREVDQLSEKLARTRGMLEQLGDRRYSDLEELTTLLETYRVRREKVEEESKAALTKYRKFYEEHVNHGRGSD